MKKIINILSLTLAVVLMMTSCQMDEPELDSLIQSDDLAYEITQNPEDPNMVIIESLTPGVIPLWITPMGRSTRVKDTIRLPFSGTYDFIYNVSSGGGFASADTTTLEITTMNLSYVDDPLWNVLTGGGPGHKKEWVMDTDGKYFSGGLSFFGTDNGWLASGDPFDSFDAGCYGGDCWTWSPDSAWLVQNNALAEGDHGVMTFSLEGGAIFSAVKPQEGGVEEEGTYFLDINAKTLRITDASILRSYKPTSNGLTGVSDWSNYTLFALDENTLRLGVVRDKDVDGEGSAMLVYNFISKEYSDNWVPADTPDPEPELPDGWMQDVSAIVDSELTWILSPETPFNFAGLDGSLLYDWSSPDNYPDSIGIDASVPATYADFSLTFNSEDYTVQYVDPSGNVTDGTYELDETGTYSFVGITPMFDLGSVYSLKTSEDNQWRILSIQKNESGAVAGMWVGVLNEETREYMAYHLLLVQDTGEAEGTEVEFDNSKFIVGDLEENGNFRIELYNGFGSTSANPPLDPAAVLFSNRIEVTFTISGATFNAGAAGSYNTAIGLADNDWSAQYWGGGDGETTVTGDGTYTVYAEPGSDFDTALVFVIDISGMANDLESIDAVSVSVDSIVLY